MQVADSFVMLASVRKGDVAPLSDGAVSVDVSRMSGHNLRRLQRLEGMRCVVCVAPRDGWNV